MTTEEKRKKHAEYQRKRYHSMTPEQKKEFLERRKPIMKKYRKNNKESINKHIREYYQEHKDKKSAINKRYYEKHRNKIVSYKGLKTEKGNLIKYLESMLDGTINDEFVVTGVKQLLERIRNNNYE